MAELALRHDQSRVGWRSGWEVWRGGPRTCWYTLGRYTSDPALARHGLVGTRVGRYTSDPALVRRGLVGTPKGLYMSDPVLGSDASCLVRGGIRFVSLGLELADVGVIMVAALAFVWKPAKGLGSPAARWSRHLYVWT